MGFDCGLVAIRNKYPLKEAINTINYIEWLDNPWNHKEDNYPDYEKYWETFIKSPSYDEEFPGIPTEDQVTYYRDNMPNEFFTWGSWSISELDSYIISNLKPLTPDRMMYVLEESQKIIFDNFLKADDNSLKEIYINEAFTCKKDADGEEYKIVRHVDGVIGLVEDGGPGHYIYVFNDSEGLFYIDNPEKYYVRQAVDRIIDMLSMIDFRDYHVYYWRSY